MPDKNHDALIENLSKDAEKGNDVSDVLNQIPFEERLQVAKEMEKANAKHRTADPALPELTIDMENDSSGQDHLAHLKSGGKNVYQLPTVAEGDFRTKFFDLIVDTKMDRDSQDSKHLEPLSTSEKSGKFYTGSGSRN